MGSANGATVADVAALVGGVAAFIAVWQYLTRLVRRTIGRRRDVYRRLSRLGTGAQLGFFTAVIGEPPAMRHTITRREDEVDEAGAPFTRDRVYVESFYVDRDYYVQTITDEDETVQAFSVTSRSKRFRPKFWLPIGSRLRDRLVRRLPRGWRPRMVVAIGRTRFVDAAPKDLTRSVQAWVGARAWRYAEGYYFGNPGNYQTYVLAHSNVGVGARADLEALQEAARLLRGGDGKWDESQEDSRPWSSLTPVHRFRRTAVPNTVTILGAMLNEDWMPAGFGPQGDEVRTLP